MNECRIGVHICMHMRAIFISESGADVVGSLLCTFYICVLTEFVTANEVVSPHA